MSQIFLTASAETVMFDLITHLPKSPNNYKVAFIPTAAEVEEGDLKWLQKDKDKLIEAGFDVEEFTITGKSQDKIESILADKQIIFLSGGNSFYLLDQIVKTGFDSILRRKIDEGVIFIGSSAGSVVMGKRMDLIKSVDDQSKALDLKSSGLEIVDYAILPHWGETNFKSGYLAGIENIFTPDTKIIPISNKQYLWFDEGKLSFIEVK